MPPQSKNHVTEIVFALAPPVALIKERYRYLQDVTSLTKSGPDFARRKYYEWYDNGFHHKA